jgi:maltose O-acetyltransferase
MGVPRTITAGEWRRAVAAALYLSFARHLPWSFRPGGKLARGVRGWLGRHMLDECGTNVNIEHGAWFGSGRGVRLADNADIGMDSLLMGPVHIGRDVMMGPRCTLIAGNHNFASTELPMNRQGLAPEQPIVIEDDVWLGAAVVVVPGVRIGRGSVIGAGSVVAKDVPPWSIAVGNPARVVRSRRDSEDVDVTGGPARTPTGS